MLKTKYKHVFQITENDTLFGEFLPSQGANCVFHAGSVVGQFVWADECEQLHDEYYDTADEANDALQAYAQSLEGES